VGRTACSASLDRFVARDSHDWRGGEEYGPTALAVERLAGAAPVA
jgi:hypothetical protein